MEESENSDINEIDSHWSDDPSEFKSRYHNFISHEQETLDGKLDEIIYEFEGSTDCLLYTSPSPRDRQKSRMPSSA